MSDITLTASIRSNLLSLQNASKLLDITSERLSTGKKVNSALDNPSSFFTARGLTNRASDLGARKDGLGQAISLLQATDKSINSITALVEQAKATAQSAEEAATSGVSTVSSVASSFVSSTGTGVTSLTSDALTVTSSATEIGATSSFTLANDGGVTATTQSLYLLLTNSAGVTTASTFSISITGDAGGSTTTITLSGTIGAALASLNAIDGLSATFSTDTGLSIEVVRAGTSIDFIPTAGTSLAELDFNALAGDGTTTLTATAAATTQGARGDDSDLLTSVTGVAVAETVTLTINGVDTIITTANEDTIADLIAKISAANVAITASFDLASQKIVISADNATTISIAESAGLLTTDFGLNQNTGTTAAAASTTYTFDNGTAVAATDLLTSAYGNDVTVGDSFTFSVTGGGGGTLFTVGVATTVQTLVDAINATDSALTATFNTTTAKIEVTSTDGTELLIKSTTDTGGSFAALGFTTGTTTLTDSSTAGSGATFGSAGSASEVSTLNSDFQSILEQIDALFSDASYKGINLLTGSNNSVVKFNADGTSSITITGLDLGVTSNTNFNFTRDASGYDFTASGDITQALTDTAAAVNQLRTIASTFGTDLGVIQTRESFTTELVNVLETGSGKLVNANLEEESANLLALQTRQALGIQALSISNQSNQSILSLFR